MKNTQQKHPVSTLKAFTLFESLVTLFIVSFLALLLIGNVEKSFRSVEEQVFFLEFERLYKSSQQLAVTSQRQVALSLSTQQVSNGYQAIQLPETVTTLTPQTIVFNENGGNSSLSKAQFQTSRKVVSYQLYIGSGRYKKSEQ